MWAVLVFGLMTGCGGSSGGGKSDAGDGADNLDGGKKDTGTDPGKDTGQDEDAEVDSGPCEPKGCDELEAECGEPDDGCGDKLDCGQCDDADHPYYFCGGGDGKYKCGCTPKSCDDLSSEAGVLVCGTMSDGCGGTLECGDTCQGDYDTCRGAGVPNQCGCSPDLGACAGIQCGTASDGCGHTIKCGDHDGGCSDARECNASTKQCVCKDTAALTATVCEGKCGTQVVDGCNPVACPTSCNQTCQAGGECSDCDCPGGSFCATGHCCVPEPLATTCGANVCGSKLNNCGQPVTCGPSAGACPGGAQCAGGQCEDPKIAALIGTYAMRNIAFTFLGDTGLGDGWVRTEGYELVEISRRGSDLVMHEAGCETTGYARVGSGAETANPPAAHAGPETFGKIAPSESILQLPAPADLQGDKDWYRPQLSDSVNAIGWRRGRPSYCPAPTTQTPEPGPDLSNLPASDPNAIGPKKPWLNGAACKCPEQEAKVHAPCATVPAAKKAACMADWVKLSLPYQPGVSKPDDSGVTDCRVIDEDKDGHPGITISAKAFIASAELHSASVNASVLWGKVDLSGKKKHSGVSMDTDDAATSVVSCIGSMLLCGVGATAACAPYTMDSGHLVRSSLVDFVPLDGVAPTGGGAWTCDTVIASKGSLFKDMPNNSDKYPASSYCPFPGQ